MSGGVDSAVAAARLVDAGHEVTGVRLTLSKTAEMFRGGARGCSSLEDSEDARRVADRLGIGFQVWDLTERFRDEVVADFVSEYRAGRTPNPCLRCNERIKFAAVLERGLALGFDAIATGHYARLEQGQEGVVLRRAVDSAKDQSYVLGVLTAAQLERCLFPLGADVKAAVRAEAAARGFEVAEKPDSYDICFIPDGDKAGFLAARLGAQQGAIEDETGRHVGVHSGAHQFTVGQRKGLRIGTPAPDGRPRYVLNVSVTTNTVTVGPRELLAVSELHGIRPTWAGSVRSGEWDGFVQVRAHGKPVRATMVVTDDAARVRLHEAVMGVAPGQAAVFYDDDRVVGSATIAATLPAVEVGNG